MVVRSVRFGDRMIEGDVEKCLWISCMNDQIDLNAT